MRTRVSELCCITTAESDRVRRFLVDLMGEAGAQGLGLLPIRGVDYGLRVVRGGVTVAAVFVRTAPGRLEETIEVETYRSTPSWVRAWLLAVVDTRVGGRAQVAGGGYTGSMRFLRGA